MKKLMFTLVGAAAFAAFADPSSGGAGDISWVGFENYTVDQTVIGWGDDGNSGNSLWSCAGDDASLVKTLGGDNAAVPAISRPALFAEEANTQYLALDTNGSELQRAIPAAGQTITDSTYIDTLIQFTPSESAPTDIANAKLAIWLGVDTTVTPNTTNLYVQGAYYDTTDGGYTLNATSNQAYKLNKSCDPNTWYRLTIKAVATLGNAAATGAGERLPGFVILIDGEEIATSSAVYSQAALTQFLAPTAEGSGGADDYLDTDNLALLKSGKFIPSLDSQRDPATLTAVGFKGTGALDDFVVTTTAPDFTPPAINFTLTWPSGYTPVSYTIDGGEAVSLAGENSGKQINVPAGSTVAFTFMNADGATKTMSLEAAADANEIDASTATYVWADYLGAAVSGAYQIDDANDLDMLRKGVAAGLATVGETFNQTANIDMTSADPFAGIGTYAANLNSGLAFQGTYDGQGFKIANITMTARNYGGVFNQVKGGTIKDLTVENITAPANATGEFGYAIVGNAGLGATLQGLTAMGSFGTAELPCSHNVAGIAIRVCGGASNVVNGVTMLETLVKDCTNNATLYGFYTKCGGITALTQDQNGVPNDYVLFDGCVNNANIAMVQPSGSDLSKIGRDGLGGILAYVADGTKMQNCVNNGTLTSPLTTAKIGGIVGWAQGRTLDDLGGNVASAAKKMIGDPAGSTITGFYATVDNGVATTVTALAKDTTYLLERNVPTNNVGEAEFTLAAAGDTIAFDTALGYTFAGTVGAAAPLVATPLTSGTITTFSAGYFPRTATAGQNGSAANPFEIADEDDLQALQAAVANNVGKNLAYVQTADIALTAAWPGIGPQAGKDLSAADYEAGAFAGTYDGGNYTISNFQMVDGVDYGALFNTIYNATIKNLKISWGANKLCSNASDQGGDTGASFVGTAKGSTLQNLTALAGTVTTVKASKDMAGIVGYLYAGTTVESCTNELNVGSFKASRKCGGIAIISQNGSGTAVIRNCKNSGTVDAASKGGIIGYANVATEIDGCENTAAVQFMHVQGTPTITVSGVNKGHAGYASNDKSGGVDGLYFATVDGDVATFVSTNDFATGGSYKVMSAGATADFAFAEAGTIAFDTALFTPTWAVTAAEGLTLTDATSGTVKTYTATAPQPAYPTYLEDADADVKAAYDTWKVANGADTNSEYENQFLVNAAPATVVPATALAITAIEQNATAGWDITVECTVSGVDLAGTVGTAKAGNGYLAVSYTDDLGGTWTTENINITASANGKVTVNVNKSGAKFMKVKLSATAEPQN